MTNPSGPLVPQDEEAPKGDEARQAVESLRGYAYQVTAAALAWIDLGEHDKLFLEVAEDYALVATQAIQAVQVKDTKGSESVTLNSENVRDAIASFVSLTASNPDHEVTLRYFTTSSIGTERAIADRPAGEAGLIYWRNAAIASDVSPIRTILESDRFPQQVREFVQKRTDDALRRDLLQRIHWDCGSPDINILRQELSDRLVVLGRDRFSLPAQESARLADTVIYRVLQQSINTEAAHRVLTRADLYDTIDRATRLSVPRSSVDAMQVLAAGLAAMMSNSQGLQLAISEPGWIVRGESLPNQRGMIARTGVETDIHNSLRCTGMCILVGASGLGKSSLAHIVARKIADASVIVDFRDAEPEDARSRLDELFRRAAGFAAKIFILEDLNQLNDPAVTHSLIRLIESLRRRDCAIIVTCYREPTPRALHSLNLEADCVVNCPYFTEDESAALVALHGGDPSAWGRIAHVTGAFGHPQLVFAFVAGMRSRGWPVEQIVDVVGNGLSSGDIEAEREAARRTLVATLPENSRMLLYRLSLMVGRFDRPLALAVANVPQEIVQAGEHMDALIGPWLETVAPGKYRVSPLAARSGQNMLQAQERTAIHSAIADHYMSGREVNGGDADLIMMHAITGKNERVLIMLSLGILKVGRPTIELLASSLPIFLLLRSDARIYPENPQVSALLRLVQFKLLVESTETGKIEACANALFEELEGLEELEQLEEFEEVPAHTMREAFLALVYGTVLGTMGIANHLNNWMQRLEEFHQLVTASDLLQSIREGFENHEKHPDMFGTLFAIGSAGLSTVAKLEHVIDQLDALVPERRTQYLSLLSTDSPDFATFISGPWVADRPTDQAGAEERANSYQRMAARTLSWAIRPITVQCWIARSVMFDEYADQKDQALAVLDEAEQVLGEEIALTRARAKIYYRAQDHATALQLLKKVADQIGLDNHVERAFALREAAISAAKVGDWFLARSWFLESREAADKCATPDMAAMAVGLTADAAIAAAHVGRMDDALSGFVEAMKALPKLDPDSSLKAAHCHRLVRHSVLWMLSHLGKREIVIDGAPPFMTPGICSNPEPNKQIKSHPLGPLDGTWYLLAEVETLCDEDVGIARSLPGVLSDGPMPMMEVSLRGEVLAKAICCSDLSRFVAGVWPFIEGVAYVAANMATYKAGGDLSKFPRGEIPLLLLEGADQRTANNVADAALSYAICSVCNGRAPELKEISAALEAKFGKSYPGMERLASALGADTSKAPTTMDEALMRVFRHFSGASSSQFPVSYGSAAIYFFQYANQSNFQKHLIPAIARWQRDAWTRIVVSESFKLSMPYKTVPAIKQALSIERNDSAFLASLILASAAAIPLSLSSELNEEFAALSAASGA